ncbi:MAG: YraN family protein [Candidatus Paceibacterota bacterium]
MKNHKEFGNYCEEEASLFLIRQGFSILFKNYLTSFGEIDIIAEKNSVIHFVEVKAVSRETFERGIRPQDHVTREKIRRIKMVAQHFLVSYGLAGVSNQIDLVAIVTAQKLSKDLISIEYLPQIF